MNGGSKVTRREIAAVLAVAAVYLAVNLFTAERSPTVSMDEVWFAEPAINCIEGRGFTTAAWDTQDRTEFWAGNAPLYSMVLSVWLRAAPFSPRGVRSLNYVLTLLAAVAVWIAVWRFALIQSPSRRALLVTAILCSYSISFSSRSGRYDCTAMLLFALVFLGAALRKPLLVALAAFFVIPAGFQLSVYSVVLAAAVLFFVGRESLRYVLWFFAGMAAGLASLIALYAANGVLGDFISTIGRHSVAGMAMASDASPFNRLAEKWRQLPQALLTDPFNLMLAAVLLGFARRERLARLAVTLAVGLPLIVQLLYTYRIYYGWMIVIPLLIATLMVPRRIAIVATLVILGGLPARWALTAVEWRARDYAPIQQLVETHVLPGEWVFTDWQAYYPVKRRAGVAFLPPYVRSFTPDEMNRVTILILGRESEKFRFAFPGVWRQVAAYRAPATARRGFGAQPYDLTVWRRGASTTESVQR